MHGKKHLMMLILLVACFVLGGCSFVLERPENFIAPPASDIAHYEERMLVTSFLAEDAHFQVPKDMENPAAFLNIDIDNDGSDEKIIFWAKSNGYQTGMTLLAKKRSNWVVADEQQQTGRGISYFDAVDVDKDGVKEIFLGVDTGGNSTLHVYKYAAGRFYEIEQINYSKLAFTDIQNDGVIDLVCALNDLSNHTSSTDINVYRWKKDGTAERYIRKVIEGFCQEFNYGEVAPGQPGLYVVMSSESSTMKVILLSLEDNELKETMRHDIGYVNVMSERQGGMIRDVTGDGVLDVLTIQPPIDASKREMREYLQVWKSWDGRAGFNNVMGLIENKSDGYRIQLPIEWLMNMHYQYVTEPGSRQLRFYDGVENQGKEASFSIVTQNAKDDVAVQGTIHTSILGYSPSGEKKYIAQINTEQFSTQALNEQVLLDMFEVEGGQ